MDQVINNLYIGDINGANDYNLLKDNGITHIVSCIPAAVYDDIKYHNIRIDDYEFVDIYSHFYNAVDFIDDALCNNGKVLVHCYAGISRSACIILAYLMAIKKYTLEDALDLLLSKRNICDPNHGFIIQLKCFEWGLSLLPKIYITNEIYNGPVFNDIKFDIANYEVLFCEDLESMYDGCIFIDRCYMPKFRPVITNNIIVYDSKNVYQLDILDYIPRSLNKPKRILIVSTDDIILVTAYWNLLYRSGMSYDDSSNFFNKNVSSGLKNTFSNVKQHISYSYNTPREKIIETQLKQLELYDKKIFDYYMKGILKYHNQSYKTFIEHVAHYFIPEIQDKQRTVIKTLERLCKACV